MWSTPSLSLLPGPPCLGVVLLVIFLSMYQIKIVFFIFIVIFTTFRPVCPQALFRFLIFLDELWWILWVRVFGLLSSSLLLYSQLFVLYVLRPSSGICWTLEPTQEFEPCPLFNPRESPVLIPLNIIKFNGWVFLCCYSPAVRIEPAIVALEPMPITITLCVQQDT